MTQHKKTQHSILISSQVCGSSNSAALMGARENLLPLLGIPPTSVAPPRPPGSPGGAQLTGDFTPVISTLCLGGRGEDLHLNALTEEVHLKQAPGPKGMPLVELTQSHPQGPLTSSDRKRPLGINPIHIQTSPLSIHTSSCSPTHSSHCGRTSCACSRKPAFLFFVQRHGRDKPRWAQEPQSAACISPVWAQQKQHKRNEKLSPVVAVTQPRHPHQGSRRIHVLQHPAEGFRPPRGLLPRPHSQ